MEGDTSATPSQPASSELWESSVPFYLPGGFAVSGTSRKAALSLLFPTSNPRKFTDAGSGSIVEMGRPRL